MNSGAKGKAAELIVQAWQSANKLETLPADCKPQSMAEAYAIQAELATVVDQAVVGWKIAATAKAGQQHIGVDSPIAGRLFAHRVHQQSATVSFAGNDMRIAEAEFVFKLGQDLAPRSTTYSEADVKAAVSELYVAIELPDSRFRDFVSAGGAQLAADNACAHEFVLGDRVTADWQNIDLAQHPVTLFINDKVVTTGSGADVLGSPWIALTWLANELSDQGIGLQSGQLITTGVCGKPSPISAGDHIIADFGDFGRAEAFLGP